jgi:hypothetical protein
MRARDQSQRAVVLSAVIEMNADSEHSLENRSDRANMNDTGFARPWTPALDVELFANGNRTVLMPRNFPVRLWTLVEEDSPHCEALISEHRCYGLPNLIRGRDPADDLIGEEVANSMLIGVECLF